MFWSNSFIPTLKEVPQEAESISHQLMLRAGLIRMLSAGVYSYLPLGLKVLTNIEAIIRQEMNACNASELLLPALQPQELWQRSGRDKDIGEVMVRFIDRRGRHMCLGPTHEEVITDLVKNHLSSYRHLPLVLYQIQTKFRDEIRPRFGLIRACEFIMKDAYSFDKDQTGLDKNYKLIYQAYNRIFKRCGLEFHALEADPGVMGGSLSHEFMVSASDGEDVILVCPKCKNAQVFKERIEDCAKCKSPAEKVNAIEVGHIFQLGVKYSSVLGAKFLDDQGELKPVIMGCYGIGVSRLIQTIIAQHHDDEGIIWPDEVAPYKVDILPLDVNDTKIMLEADTVLAQLKADNVEVIFDDRDERPGVKFKDADLLGFPLQVIIGKEFLKNGTIELKMRRNNAKITKKKNEIFEEIKKYLSEAATYG